jgi:flavin reductase (DIM6/NTAB) family NADH-FMN oxidoreductase RutF
MLICILAGFVTLDPKELKSSYQLVISAVVPRPIAFVSTVDASGVRNLAPFSYFNTMGHDPPLVCFSVCRKRGEKKAIAYVYTED